VSPLPGPEEAARTPRARGAPPRAWLRADLGAARTAVARCRSPGARPSSARGSVTTSWGAGSGEAARYTATSSVAQAHTGVLEQQPSKPPDPSPLVPTGLVLEQEPTGRHQRRRGRQDGDRTHVSGEVRDSSAPHPPVQIVQRARGRSPRFCFRHDPSSRHRGGPRSPSTSGGPRVTLVVCAVSRPR
jgi:hypothetical protein